MWTSLAAECALDPVVVTDATGFAPSRDDVVVIAAAGDEHLLDAAIRRVVSPGRDIAAVGASTEHRIASAVVRAGADEYFALPGDLEVLRSWLRERAERITQRADGARFADAERQKYQFEGILGESSALHDALERAAKVIPRPNVTVLLTGETGTGKELVARAIHYNGPRAAAPFVDVNCAAIPAQLLESELFGHEKGAFTDATSAKPGLIEMADGGTLFLDEIGHMPMPLQGKILRALQEREVRRVGGTRSIPFDVRVIAATHVDLEAAVRAGEFREDLYYRLNVVPIVLPPLRERRDDIVPLARHFLARFAEEYGIAKARFTPAAERALVLRDWAGNIRELRNVVERALLLSASPVIGEPDVTGDGARAARASGLIPFPAPIQTIVRAAAEQMLARCDNNKSEAARQLGITRARLQRILDSVDTEPTDQDSSDV